MMDKDSRENVRDCIIDIIKNIDSTYDVLNNDKLKERCKKASENLHKVLSKIDSPEDTDFSIDELNHMLNYILNASNEMSSLDWRHGDLPYDIESESYEYEKDIKHPYNVIQDELVAKKYKILCDFYKEDRLVHKLLEETMDIYIDVTDILSRRDDFPDNALEISSEHAKEGCLDMFRTLEAEMNFRKQYRNQ